MKKNFSDSILPITDLNYFNKNKNMHRKNILTQNTFFSSNSQKNLSIKIFHNYLQSDIEYVNRLKFYSVRNITNNKITLFNLKSKIDNETNEKEKIKQFNFKNLIKINNLNCLKPKQEKNVKLNYSSYENKMKHMLFEENLENELNKIYIKLKNIKIDLEKQNEIKENLTKKIDELNLDLEILNNFNSLTCLDKKINNLINSENEDPKKILERKLKLENFLIEKNSEVNELKIININKLKKLIEEKNIINKKIEISNNSLNLLKIKYKEIKNKLLIHYHQILNEGKDTRNEGLVWIILKIWKLDSNVILDYLPKFLDEKSILFLFNYANGLLTLDKLNKILKEKLKDNKYLIENNEINNENNIFNKFYDTFKTTLKKKIFLDKNSILKLNKENNNVKFRELEEYFKTKEYLFDVNSNNKLNKIKILKNEINNYKKFLKEMKNNELIRLNKEFYTNDYIKRYNTKKEIVLGAIVGEKNVNNVIYKLLKKQNEYFSTLNTIRIGNKWKTKLNNIISSN